MSELQFITVEAVRRGEAVVSLKGKTRTVLIVKPLQKKLLRYIRERDIASGAVFVTRTGKLMSRTNILGNLHLSCPVSLLRRCNLVWSVYISAV